MKIIKEGTLEQPFAEHIVCHRCAAEFIAELDDVTPTRNGFSVKCPTCEVYIVKGKAIIPSQSPYKN